MNKESLQEIRTKLIEVISNSNINPLDKAELLINLYHLLDIKNYDEVIKALSRADKYKCMDFDIVRLDLLLNLNHMLDNRKDFEERIKILTLYDKKR